MMTEILETPFSKDIVSAADMRCATYVDHLNKVAMTKRDVANLLGKVITDPTVAAIAEALCGEWQ